MGNSNEINVCIYLIGDLLNEIMILANGGKSSVSRVLFLYVKTTLGKVFLQSLISFKIGWLLLF